MNKKEIPTHIISFVTFMVSFYNKRSVSLVEDVCGRITIKKCHFVGQKYLDHLRHRGQGGRLTKAL